MSADGEDTKNLNKEGEILAATVSEGIPINTPTDVSSCSLKNVEQTPITSTKADLDDLREIEEVIEKKLPGDKEKALDVDSELDFELKWDDDTDLNENLGDNDTDLGNAHKELESDLLTEKDLDSSEKKTVCLTEKDTDSLDKEFDSACPSTEKDLDSLQKTDSNATSIELKWDDDANLNENQGDDMDLGVATKELESNLLTEKDLDSTEKKTESPIKKDTDSLDKEFDSAFTSVEENLDSLHKTDSNVTSIEKDPDSINREIDSASTSTEKDLDSIHQELETDLLSIEKETDSLDKDSDIIFAVKEKGIDGLEKDSESIAGYKEEGLYSGDKKTDSDFTATENLHQHIGDAIPEKDSDSLSKGIQDALTSLEKDTLDEIDGNIVDTDSKIDNAMDVDDICEETQTKATNKSEIVPEDSDDDRLEYEMNIDTSAKKDTGLKTLTVESETNSLDEELVYSDAEAPDIEDKILMDEIDAEITAEIIKDKLESETEPPQISAELLTFQKESEDGKTTEKESSQMDVDDDFTNSVKLLSKSDPNNTSSTITDLETSIYDINKEHGLDRPDVMIDIPTQELIESFDDTNPENFKLDQSINVMDKPDLVETITKEDTQNLKDEINLEKCISDKTNETDPALEKMLRDEVENAVATNKSAGDTIQTESMDIDTHVSKEIEKPYVIDNDSTELSSNVETRKLDQENVTTLKEKVNHANIVLVATTQPEVLNSGPEAVELTKEVKDVESEALKLKEVEDTIATCVDEAEPATSNKDIKTTENSDLKEPATSIKDKEVESLDDSKLKNVDFLTTQADKTQPNKEVIDSSENSKNKNDDLIEPQVDEAQPSTSDKHPKDPSNNVKLKDVETHEAQPSTNHSELSDEDQEATDSLGLLAESSRVMEDDDEQEQEAEPDDDDDDDDFDQDDESNQMTPEHSEDSNAQQSEADVPREAMDVDEPIDAQEPHDMADTHDMDDAADENDDKSTDEKDDSNDEKDESNDEKVDSNDEKVESNDEKDESNDDKDDSNDERDDFQIQIADVVSQTVVEAVATPGESVETAEDTEKAVEAILEDKKEESADVPPVAAIVEDKETVKPTDADSDSAASSKLRQLLLQEKTSAETSEPEKKSPSKTMKLEISKPKNEINIVDLGESSSEDDVQVVKKSEVAAPSPKDVPVEESQEASEVKPATEKSVMLETKEVLVKPPAVSPVKPETTASKTSDSKASIDFGLEIYSLDSDDEETEVRSKRKSKLTAIELDKARQTNKCINMRCTSDGSVPLVPASMSAAVYYAANQQRGGGLCLYCAKRFEERSEKLIEGVKDLTPFLSMDMCMIREEFVEISDSDSEEEQEVSKDDEVIGEKAAKFLEEHLEDVFNGAWKKFNMEERLLAAQAEINVEVGQLEEECKEIDAMLNECQKETDKLRNDLYSAFADDRRELPAITIYDTPANQWSGLEDPIPTPPPVPENREQPQRYQKRRAATAPAPEPSAKRAAIPLGYAPLEPAPPAPSPAPAPAPAHKQEPKQGPSAEVAAQNDDDNADISVVKLSVEAAPAGLPPPGVATRPPLRPNMLVYAMRNTFGAWHKVRIVEVQPKITGQFTTCRVRFEQPKTMTKLLPARCLAYEHPPDVRLTIGTRVVALFKDHRVSVEKKEEGEKKEAYYSGIVAEIPNPVNSFRYLIFFDDGYAQYVQHSVTRLVCECAPRVWDEVHPFSRQFVRDYLRAYPERPMVRLHAGQSIKTEWDGKWWVSKVLQVDASLVLVYFDGKKDNKTEWIYRGSTRLAPLYLELQAAERTRTRPLPRAQAARRYNMPYVEYTRSDEAPEKPPQPTPAQSPQQIQAQMEQEIRRQRAVAKKSTAPPAAPAHAPAPAPAPRDAVTSRVVFYTPKNAIKPHKMVPHTCGPKCKRTDVLALKDLRTYNPLTKPLLSGWERQQVRYRIPAVKAIMYRAPCGRRIRDYAELHRYLQATGSDMGVDLFDFNPATHCLAEFLLNKCLISKKDLSHGKENVPVPCVNYYDSSLPEFCSYNTERTPTAGVPLNLDPDFLCGCDCTDDCADKSKCACWKMTLEGARTIGLDTNEVGYVYKRLPEPLPSGIYECNSRCKCKQTCLNRVAQHPLQLKLQVFKTANRGWGIRALNDVPKGAFLCVYAGNLLTDATANLDGLNEGDEYLAELDYIEVVEQMKEGFEEDIPEDAKKLDEEESESSPMSSSDEEQKQDGDDDFRPAMPSGQYTPSEYSKRLRKREKSKKAKEKEEKEKKEREEKQREKDGDDCITISDDEELREPAHFAAQAGMKGKEFVSKYKSVRTLFGKDEACYIMDAKVQGNIGRYLNHSCTPNVFVQNVFVDTHDPRFPWVAFFALSQIRAGTELTWNYNYDVGSVPGKVLYCYCNAPNCRGRLL